MERDNSEEKFESVNHEMAKNTEQTNHPWNTLTTVTTFDQGNNIKSTFRLNNIDGSQASEQITRLDPSPSVLIITLLQQFCTVFEGSKIRRNQLYYAICDKLHQLGLIDSSYNNIEFEVLRGQYQRALYHLVTVAYAGIGNESALCEPRFTRSFMSEWSRYYREFREISFIASGGFGKVFKAQHYLDGIVYAVKKIPVSSDNIEMTNKHLNEVKTLAKLNHPNIVPYKAAWIETMLPSFISNVSSPNHESRRPHTSKCTKKSKACNLQSVKDSHSNTSSPNLNTQDIAYDNKASSTTGMYIKKIIKQQNRIHESAGDYLVCHDIINERFQELNSSTDIIGERLVEESNVQEYIEDISSDVVSFRNSNSNENLNQTITDNSDSRDTSNEESNNHQEVCTYSSNNEVVGIQNNKQYMILYIQMALCEQTLERWMRNRINGTPQPMIAEVLQQILHGVDYIHLKKIVHHDIKPSNIFISISGRLQIQLGDFGLACPLQRKNYHAVLGTHMYAAPEQLQGKCDPKSDIYSVGIVLTKLVIPTQTQMELCSIISSLKNGNIPESLPIDRHNWARMIIQMVQENPNRRPWTKQLLQELKEDKDVSITELSNTVVTLKNNIRDKDNTIEELQNEIELLRNQIMKLKASKI